MIHGSWIGTLLTLVLTASALCGQTNCPLPPALQPASTNPNVFTDAQEVDLGDAMAETLALHFDVIENDEVVAHIREIGNRLIQHLPSTKLEFRFYLVDLPEVNAFSIAGGRVYVSRKLVAFARNDDELAGVVAHELGHIVTHQSAVEMTRNFREVLGVTQVGDRQDIFRKFHSYVENAARLPRAKRGQEERHQLVADQTAIFTLARAGYSPQAMVDFWDRFGALHGAKGNWFTDLFGATSPEEHRLRDMVKNTATFPPGCAEPQASLNEAGFKLWQESVVDLDVKQSESLPALLSKRKLSERLRAEVRNLRFSPDGKYLIAQDDGGINVVSRDPFAFLFYVPAPDARDAHFSSDSKSIAFSTYGLRIEVWNIAERKRASAHEITLRDSCLQSELSLDGNTLVCLDTHRDLLLVDVSTSTVIYRKEHFYEPTFLELLGQLNRLLSASTEAGNDSGPEDWFRFVNLGFSPDGRYLLASHGVAHVELGIMGSSYSAPTSVLLFDLLNRRELPVPGSIKAVVGVSFAFLASNEIVGINPASPQKSPVLKFPAGEKMSELPLGAGLSLRGAAHGEFLLVGPLKGYALGIMELASKQIRVVFTHTAADMYDGVFVTERMNGEIALRSKDGEQPIAVLQLPESSLGRLKTAAVSPDLNYLAVSTRSRGAIWDIAHDRRVFHVRGFNDLGFYGNVAYADFPKLQDSPRAIGELRIDTATATTQRELHDEIVVQQGLYLVETKPRSKSSSERSNAEVQVFDIQTGQILWSRNFPQEIPFLSINSPNSTVFLRWRVSSPGAQEELRKFPELKGKVEKEDYFCEVADANLGGLISHFAVKTNHGSLLFKHGESTKTWAVMEAAGDQILSYALPAGTESGHFFGSEPSLSISGLLAVISGKHELTLYDLATSLQLRQYVFPQPVAFKAFSTDGKRLLVFTTDQTLYFLDATIGSPGSQTAATSSP